MQTIIPNPRPVVENIPGYSFVYMYLPDACPLVILDIELTEAEQFAAIIAANWFHRLYHSNPANSSVRCVQRFTWAESKVLAW